MAGVSRRDAALVGVMLALAAGLHVAVRAHGRLREAREALPVLGTLPAFALTDQDGRSFDVKNLDGKVWVADFIFTRCVSICPLLTERMRELSRWLDEERHPPSDVGLLSITVDPQGDTPAVLAAWARAQHLDLARFHLLTGPSSAVEDVVVRGFKLAMGRPETDPETGRMDVLHGSHLVLVDRTRRIRGYYDGDRAGLARLEHDLARLVGEHP
jgi:protein SCO1/2